MNKLIDDPRITLYALGQLSPEEEKELVMEINNDQETLAEIESIKRTANLLSKEMNVNAQARLEPERIEEISKVYAKKKLKWMGVFATLACSVLILIVSREQTGIGDQKISLKKEIAKMDRLEEMESEEIAMNDADYSAKVGRAAPARSKGLAFGGARQNIMDKR
ncbi:MAG: hypothetical protein CO099_07680, partial [Bdellovibrio sp. CG_4_9_14_3_um_filter_39_7]